MAENISGNGCLSFCVSPVRSDLSRVYPTFWPVTAIMPQLRKQLRQCMDEHLFAGSGSSIYTSRKILVIPSSNITIS